MKKGFTLIELLVVIAIIGILASIVMISMSGASNQAKDARIQGNLSQVRSIAELIQNDDGSYAQLCPATNLGVTTTDDNYGTQLGVIQADIDSQQGVSSSASTTCYDSATAYCVAAALVGDSGNEYCIDSDGRATIVAVGTCDSSYECQ